MKTPKYDARLPQTRVKEKTLAGLVEIAHSQEMSLADVVRAALKEYLTPGQPPEVMAVPIAGTLKPIDGEYIILPLDLLDGDGAAAKQDTRPLAGSTNPPAAPSIAQTPPAVTNGRGQ